MSVMKKEKKLVNESEITTKESVNKKSAENHGVLHLLLTIVCGVLGIAMLSGGLWLHSRNSVTNISVDEQVILDVDENHIDTINQETLIKTDSSICLLVDSIAYTDTISPEENDADSIPALVAQTLQDEPNQIVSRPKKTSIIWIIFVSMGVLCLITTLFLVYVFYIRVRMASTDTIVKMEVVSYADGAEEVEALRAKLQTIQQEKQELEKKNEELTTTNNSLEAQKCSLDAKLQTTLKEMEAETKKRKDSETRATLLENQKNELSESIKRLQKKADGYDKLLDTRKEKDLLKYLDELRKQNPMLPEVTTLAAMYKNVVKTNKDATSVLTALIHDLVLKIDDEYHLEEYYEKLCQNDMYVCRVRPVYEDAKRYIESFFARAEVKNLLTGEIKYFERLALMQYALQFVIEVSKSFGSNEFVKVAAQEQRICADFNSDMLQLYMMRYYVAHLASDKTTENFVDAVKQTIPDKVKELKQNYKIELPLTDKAFVSRYEELHKALQKIKETDRFVDLMWDNFVEEFLRNAPQSQDKGWFFGLAVAIALYSADYVECLHGKDLPYCFNLSYLLSGFDPKHVDQFELNTPDHSSEYANRMYHWLTDLGVKELKALVEKYNIFNS